MSKHNQCSKQNSVEFQLRSFKKYSIIIVKDLQLMGNLFDSQAVAAIIQRINKLRTTSLPIWGKMSVSQMLARCNVTYTLIYDRFSPKPGFMKKALLKLFLKPIFTNQRPIKKCFWTPSEFRVREQRIFWFEKMRLVTYIQRTQELGAS